MVLLRHNDKNYNIIINGKKNVNYLRENKKKSIDIKPRSIKTDKLRSRSRSRSGRRRRRRYGQNNINQKGNLKKRSFEKKNYYISKARKHQKLLNKFRTPNRNKNIKCLDNNKNKALSYYNSKLNVEDNKSVSTNDMEDETEMSEDCRIVYSIFEDWGIPLLNSTSVVEIMEKEDYYNETRTKKFPCCFANNNVICEEDKIVEITLEENEIVVYNETDSHKPLEIPVNICKLKDLKKLSLTTNNLTGSIPENIGNLENLEYLWLYYNSISGTIPSSIGNLSNLKSLNLHGNKLTGNIITEIGKLTKLETLDLHNNLLEGDIPDSLGELPNLKRLYLNENNLNITNTNYNLTNLVSCNFNENVMSQSFSNALKNYSCASAATSITISIPSLLLFILINLFLLFKSSLF